MNIDELTLGQIKEIQGMSKQEMDAKNGYEHLIGKPVFVRTVTMHYTGRLKAVYSQELVITDAAWVADSGRFSDALKTGSLNEVEPYPDGSVVVGRGGVTDVSAWHYGLPRVQK
jgi:hypothetical protein